MRVVAAAVAFGLVVGCASTEPPPPPQVTGRVVAAAGINPDVNGRPSPARVRVYQLRARGAFASADFVSLYQRPEQALGADLVSSEDFLMQPGQSRDYSAEIDPTARYLGVIVAFRDLGNAQWRSGVALPEEELAEYLAGRSLAIQLEELSVNVALEAR